MAFNGINVRATGSRIMFRVLLLNSSGTLVTSGTTTLRLYKLLNNGALSSYDFNDHTFKGSTLTTETAPGGMTHQRGNNNTTDTGIWTYHLSTVTGFSDGDIIFALVNNSGATPAWQVHQFQYGGSEGDGARLDFTQSIPGSPVADTTGDAFKTITATLPTGNQAAGANGGLPLLDANLVVQSNVARISGGATEADRLEAALTTANGIDINMEQSIPGTPTADTTGDAMANAAISLPNKLEPGTVNGLARVTDITAISGASLRLVSTTMQAGSSASSLIANSSDLPSGDTDDIYNNLMVIAYDSSAGDKPNVRYVNDYDAASDSFVLDVALDFTPEIGVDTFEVWGIAPAEAPEVSMPELTTGFSAGNPNNLNSYLKAIMQAAASVPTGLGTFDPATDALEALRNQIDSMSGSGFATGTDSLKAIRDAIDDLIAPAVVAGGGTLSGVGFLSECVSLIRKATDEPDTLPKYTDDDLIEYIHSAFDQVLASVNVETDHPILVRYNVPVVPGTRDYLLPCNVAEIWRVAKIDSTTGIPAWEVWPTNEYTFRGDGFTIEGNILRFHNLNLASETLEVLYVAAGDVSIHTATADAGTESSITFAASPTDGTLDIRSDAYLGYVVRTLSATGAGQERIVSSYDVATRVATVRPNWTTAPDNTTVYEVLPQYSRLIKHVVADYATLDVLSNEAKSTRRAEAERRLQRKMTALKLILAKKVRRFGTQGPGIDTYDNVEGW
ncbi:hypothetical protein AMJ85_00205 [candidate division BRC1 bacterium SM23_51]|nr:MAG: hypothetical protein AMJ85_00205 [candidate division BRC1 bacterium SM23_51]